MADRHIFQHHSPDSILGIRLGVNVADKLNRLPKTRALSPRGKVLKRAAEIAVLRHHKGAARNAGYTLRLEDLEVALLEQRGELDQETLADLIGIGGTGGETVARERRKIETTRYAENRAIRQAAIEAKKAERAAKRAARKAAKQ